MHKEKTLSRAALPSQSPASDDGEAQIHFIVNSVTIFNETMDRFKKRLNKDPALQLLKRFILSGWPKEKKDIPEEIRAYKGFQDEMREKKWSSV